jgi:hypothetical protein
VLAEAKRPKVVQVNFSQAFGLGPLQYRGLKRAADQLGKQRDNVDPHDLR